MSLALLFPGQGAQHPQALPWLAHEPRAAATLAALAGHLGADWRERAADAVWLQSNVVAQPLLTGLGMATWQALADDVPAPVAVAGYSVGELPAFAAAGVFDGETALALAAFRAAAMDAAAIGQPGGLMALQGPAAAERAQDAAGVTTAIRIGPERVLVGGPLDLLAAAAEAWSRAGLRCTRLPIGVASHTPAMAPAARAVAAWLSAQALRPPRAAVVCNWTGTATRSPAALATALAAQVAATVRWDDCMDSLAERGVRCVLEVGPGGTLAAMWRERHPGIAVRSCDEFRSREGVIDWVRQQLD
ncbi:acyltransferase domain-containing protein [Roseateles puraquae]|uniref:acyltransferase domain-containing protein n=1 Tax=Roseateles puraquae TaxID=431059 RepID=UPI0031DD6BB8